MPKPIDCKEQYRIACLKLEEFFSENEDSLYFKAYRGVKDHQLAQSFVQDSFFNLFKVLDKYQKTGNLLKLQEYSDPQIIKARSYVTVENVVKDYFKSSSSKDSPVHIFLEEDGSSAENTSSPFEQTSSTRHEETQWFRSQFSIYADPGEIVVEKSRLREIEEFTSLILDVITLHTETAPRSLLRFRPEDRPLLEAVFLFDTVLQEPAVAEVLIPGLKNDIEEELLADSEQGSENPALEPPNKASTEKETSSDPRVITLTRIAEWQGKSVSTISRHLKHSLLVFKLAVYLVAVLGQEAAARSREQAGTYCDVFDTWFSREDRTDHIEALLLGSQGMVAHSPTGSRVDLDVLLGQLYEKDGKPRAVFSEKFKGRIPKNQPGAVNYWALNPAQPEDCRRLVNQVHTAESLYALDINNPHPRCITVCDDHNPERYRPIGALN